MNRLPVETIERIFDNATHIDLVRTSGVSHRWRAISQNHPCFWDDIDLCSVSDAAIAIFSLRLQQRQDQNVRVTIDLPKAEFCALFTETVLPLIVGHLFRLKTLKLSFPRGALNRIYEELSAHPAPFLETLHMHSISHLPSQGALPVTLFAGCAPRLVEVWTMGIITPDGGKWPPCFSNVHTLTLSLGGRLTSYHHRVDFDFSHVAGLPSLDRGLHVYGGIFLVTESTYAAASNVLSRIRNFTLVDPFHDIPRGIWAIPALARLHTLRTTDHDKDLLALFAQHFPSESIDATVEWVHTDRASVIILTTPGSIIPSRTLQSSASEDDIFLHPLWDVPSIVNRIVKLTLRLSSKYALSRRLPFLSECSELEIVLKDQSPIRAYRVPEIRPQFLPHLSRVKIRGYGSYAVAVDLHQRMYAWYPGLASIEMLAEDIDGILCDLSSANPVAPGLDSLSLPKLVHWQNVELATPDDIVKLLNQKISLMS